MKSLVDRFGRVHDYLRISVTDRCNLRCMYCMPQTLDVQGAPRRDGNVPREDDIRPGNDYMTLIPGGERLLTFEEIVEVARVFVSMGIRKIRLTGGEPLVRKGVVSLVRELAALPGLEHIGMTTNGVLLTAHAADLRDAGLTHLNISLDTLRAERFERIAMRPLFEDVLHGIEAAFDAGFPSIKLNVVVMGGVNDDELPDFVALARDRTINVRFIEYMPFRFNRWEIATFVSWQEMIRRISLVYDWESASYCADAGGVAKEFRLVGWTGTIGFITSMSDHFCNDCNRLRLTADGSVKSCLFHPAEVNLRSVLRSAEYDRDLERYIRSAVLQKPTAHPPVAELVALDNRSMIEIGG